MVAAGTAGVYLTKRDKPVLVCPCFGLSLSQFDMKNITVKGVVSLVFLLYPCSSWLTVENEYWRYLCCF